MTEFSARRSAMKMWLLGLSGIPFVVLGADVLTRRRITGALSAAIFSASDPQLLEPRDVIWAVVLVVIGLGLSGFGLKELVSPRKVAAADAEGLRLYLSGPFRSATLIPWDGIEDIGAEMLEDDGDLVAVMWLRLNDPELIPPNPWGARWVEGNLAILASDWDKPAAEVAEAIAEVAITTARPPAVAEEQ
jgi:hypothetical protein